MTIAEQRARLAVVQASYDRTKALATSLMAAYPPLSADSLLDIARSIAGLAQGGYARLGAAEYAGLVRVGLAAATGNISRARALIEAGNASREDTAANLLNKAGATIAAVNAMAAGLKSATEAVAEGIRAVGLAGLGINTPNLRPSRANYSNYSNYHPGVYHPGVYRGRLNGLGVIGWDDVAVVLVVVVSVALIYSLLSAVQASTTANSAADFACDRDAAAGHPCTGAQWSRYRDDALAASSTFSLVPNFAHALQGVGDSISGVLFWGGLLVVGAAIGYAAWTAAPAAMITRDRLRARAMAGVNRSRRRTGKRR